MSENRLKLFALNRSHDFGQQVAASMGIALSNHEEREFEDGEHKVRPLENVRGTDVFVIHSLYSDEEQSVNDKLIRLLFFLGALKDAGADRLTAVVPYLCYARKDRKTKSRDPLSSRYVACLLESVGIDRVLTLDVHNLSAYQNAFRCRTEHLEAKKLFLERFIPLIGDDEAVVVSPDTGGVKRAEVEEIQPHRFFQLIDKTVGHENPGHVGLNDVYMGRMFLVGRGLTKKSDLP